MYPKEEREGSEILVCVVGFLNTVISCSADKKILLSCGQRIVTDSYILERDRQYYLVDWVEPDQGARGTCCDID